MTLANPTAFYDTLRSGLLGPTLSPTEVDGCNALLAACSGWSAAWAAYALATAFHETAHALQPVQEANWLSPDARQRYLFRMYDIEGQRPDVARRLGNLNPGDGVKYAGRGLVQITGFANYSRAELELGHPFTTSPDLALSLPYAAAILRRGMSEGWFTGKKLSDYLGNETGTAPSFAQARKIINGQDQADLIAGYALSFQSALLAGQWAST